MKKIYLSLILILVFLSSVCGYNFLKLKSKQLKASSNKSVPLLGGDQIASKLSNAIQIKTISYEEKAKFDPAEFSKLIDYLKQTFPLAAAKLSPVIINDYSLLYTWRGSDPSLKPALFMAHLDVVPIEPGTEKIWKHPPYDGVIADGFVWGRGALDDKVNVITILEAAETLLFEDFQPKRTMYFAFGHDEELSGEEGALKISEYLKEKGVSLDSVMDEGLFILDNQLPGIKAPVAFIGAAEKGYLDVELVVDSKGGHSSQPPAETAAGILSKAILKIEQNPFPVNTKGVVDAMFDYAAPEMQGALKVVFANRWLFSPLLISELKASPTTNALLRTTAVTTMLSGSQKSNVMPAQAKAVVNIRILPGDTISSVLEYLKKIIADERVQINKISGGNEPIQASDLNSKSFLEIQAALLENFPEVVAVPSLMIGGTDSKHFAEISDNIYRFSPMHLTSDELAGFHGSNERIRVDNLKKIVSFYISLFQSK